MRNRAEGKNFGIIGFPARLFLDLARDEFYTYRRHSEERTLKDGNVSAKDDRRRCPGV
jgi:hypothetical protein